MGDIGSNSVFCDPPQSKNNKANEAAIVMLIAFLVRKGMKMKKSSYLRPRKSRASSELFLRRKGGGSIVLV